jgi:hypothetical protein
MLFVNLKRKQPKKREQAVDISPKKIQSRISKSLADLRQSSYVLDALAEVESLVIVHLVENMGEQLGDCEGAMHSGT